MAKTFSYERAFQLLSDAAFEYGIDRIIEEPIDFLMKSLNISKNAALRRLNELKKRGIIAFNFEGARIKSVRIIENELPKKRFLYESDNRTRVLEALWKHKQCSKSDPKIQIVHQSSFEDIQGEADVLQTALYESFKRFSKNGWIEIKYSGISQRPRIIYVVIKDKFPLDLLD